MFCKKGALKNYAKFREKHLWRSLFFNKVVSLLQNISGRLLLNIYKIISNNYFLISASTDNNFIYSSPIIGRGDKNTVFLVVEPGSILYSGKIVYLQIDWFTG